MKKILVSTIILMCSIIGSITLAFGAENSGFDNFTKKNIYQSGQFSDVKSGAWYENDVKTAYELGLVKGSSATAFNSKGSVTIAETIALACRLNSIYNTGTENFVQGKRWYDVYVQYAAENGIINEGQYSQYNKRATREEFVTILGRALPEDTFNEINRVESGKIPDVNTNAKYADTVYKFYNAGILKGSDEYGNFKPDSNIQRSEVATIISRLADPTKRVTFNLSISPDAVTGIKLNKDRLYLRPNETFQLYAVDAATGERLSNVTWECLNPNAISVSADGKLKVIGKYWVNTGVTVQFGSQRAQCKILELAEKQEVVKKNGKFYYEQYPEMLAFENIINEDYFYGIDEKVDCWHRYTYLIMSKKEAGEYADKFADYLKNNKYTNICKMANPNDLFDTVYEFVSPDNRYLLTMTYTRDYDDDLACWLYVYIEEYQGNSNYANEPGYVNPSKQLPDANRYQAAEDIAQDISTISDLRQYLNTHMNKIQTSMGDYEVSFSVKENEYSIRPYDIKIEADFKYGTPWFNIEYSIKMSEEEKAEAVEDFRDFQKQVADIAIASFPKKKIEGRFYDGFYKYPNIQVGYESIQALSWKNYSGDFLLSDYDESEVSKFHWDDKYDDYKFD